MKLIIVNNILRTASFLEAFLYLFYSIKYGVYEMIGFFLYDIIDGPLRTI